MRADLLLIPTLLLAGCVSTTVVPIAADTVEVTTSAAPACGAAGAQSVAIHMAAVETLRSGYDSFIVVGANAQNNVGVIGYTPTITNTYGNATAYGSPGYATSYGQSTSYTTGGLPIIAGTHDQSFVIKMFHTADPGTANAVSARRYLGPDWQKDVVGSNPHTCTGA